MHSQELSFSLVVSPLAYFGSRPENTQSVITLIKQAQLKGMKFLRCQELFSGSATFSLTAIANCVAQKYFINDALPYLEQFWRNVKDKPDELIEKYNALCLEFSRNESREAYFKLIQNLFNDAITTVHYDTEQSARFAFIINHAENGMPMLDEKDQLVCKPSANQLYMEIDNCFAERVKQVHSLFNENEVIFSSLKLAEKLPDLERDLTEEDFIQCDPPYPGMADANEAPKSHVYIRTEPKATLHDQINQMVELFLKKGASFHLSYGAQGYDDDKGLITDQAKCVLHLSGTPDGPFGVYADRWFFSPQLAQLVQTILKAKVVVLTEEIKKKLAGKSMQEAASIINEIIQQQIKE